MKVTNTKTIQSLVCKAEVLKYNHICENVSFLFGDSIEIDVVSLNKSGFLTEFEVKISRSDFLADSKKRKWISYTNRLEKQICNYFCYVCPEDLIAINEVPDFAGLIYVIEGKLTVIKKPKLLHHYHHDREKIVSKFCAIMAQRMYSGSCRLTFDNKLRIQKQKEYEAENSTRT